jgi:hypothetical protein
MRYSGTVPVKLQNASLAASFLLKLQPVQEPDLDWIRTVVSSDADGLQCAVNEAILPVI